MAILLVALSSWAHAERASVRLLTIGNSFADDATRLLPHLAKAGDKELLVFRANLGGASLERHATHLAAAQENPGDAKGRPYRNKIDPRTGGNRDFTLPEALESAAWDFVTVQQVSHQSFKPESYHPHVDRLIAAVRKHAPQAEILIHETWAYREDHALFRESPGFTPADMHAQLQSAYRALADQTGLRLIPAGDAFHAARQTPRWRFAVDQTFDYTRPEPGQLPDQRSSLNVGWKWETTDKARPPQFHLDAIHANTAGQYLGAAVFYLVLFDADQVPSDYTPGDLSAGDAAQLREIARQVVSAERARAGSRVPSGER